MVFCIYLGCNQWLFELLLPLIILNQSGQSPLTSGINKAFSPRELPLTGYFLFLWPFSANGWSEVSEILRPARLEPPTMPRSMSLKCDIWTSPGRLDHVYMPKSSEFLPCDWLIRYLRERAIEQLYLIKWPVNVFIFLFNFSSRCIHLKMWAINLGKVEKNTRANQRWGKEGASYSAAVFYQHDVTVHPCPCGMTRGKWDTDRLYISGQPLKMSCGSSSSRPAWRSSCWVCFWRRLASSCATFPHPDESGSTCGY